MTPTPQTDQPSTAAGRALLHDPLYARMGIVLWERLQEGILAIEAEAKQAAVDSRAVELIAELRAGDSTRLLLAERDTLAARVGELREALERIHTQHTRRAALYDEAEPPCICGPALAQQRLDALRAALEKQP